MVVFSATWMVCGYAHADVNHDPSQAGEVNHHPDENNSSAGSHCGHMSAHMIGIVQAEKFGSDFNNAPPVTFILNDYSSLISSPPYHPPTI